MWYPPAFIPMQAKDIKRTPSGTLKKFVESKKRMRDRTPANRSGRCVRRRLLAPTDSDYGPNSARPDRSETDPDLYQQQQQAAIDELTLSQNERLRVRDLTSRDREAWFREREKKTHHGQQLPSGGQHA